ncbi:hypothetical protein V8E51_010500 [Hyaloscypha variabilis]
MASEASQRVQKSDQGSDPYPTAWTKWEWNEQYRRNVRARERGRGEWEYEYAVPHVENISNFDEELGLPRYTLRDLDAQPRTSEQSQQHEEPGWDQSGNYRVESPSPILTTPLDDMREELRTARDSVSIEIEFDRMALETEADPEPIVASSNQAVDGSRFGTENDNKGKEILCPTCSMTFSRGSDLERHHKTVHLKEGTRPYQCPFDDCSANVRSWTTAAKLRLHVKNWHSYDSETEKVSTLGYSSPNAPTETRFEFLSTTAPTEKGFEGQSHSGYASTLPNPELNYGGYLPPVYPDYESYRYRPPPQPQFHKRSIFAKDSSTSKDKLDPRFKVHKSKDFYFGRVFKVLWSEPVGSGGTEITVENAKYGEKSFHKVRRFIVVRKNKGHSTCIPILTYGYQGALKRGVHPEDHTVVYSSKTEGPFYLEGEKELLRKRPIRLDMKDPSEKLDPLSRLNYAKTYTVEHNVKVYFIGCVAISSEQEVATSFNDANPPVTPANRSRNDASPDDLLFNHTGGDDPNYPAAIPIPGSSASYSGSGVSQEYTLSSATPTTYFAPGTGTYSTPDNYPYPSQAAQPDAISYNSQPQTPSVTQSYHSPTHEDVYSSPRYDDGYNA